MGINAINDSNDVAEVRSTNAENLRRIDMYTLTTRLTKASFSTDF